MGWQERHYASEDAYHGPQHVHYRGSGMGAYDVVTKIIIANAVVYFVMFFTHFGNAVVNFGVMRSDLVLDGQIWRLLTATYLHAGFWHIGVNMLMLYFFGPMLERRWGAKQFLIVYTLGGVAGNIVLTAAGGLGFINPNVPGLGASGSVWAVMAAAAACYPNTEVLFMFFLPLRLRTLVAVYGVWFVWNIMQQGVNYGGDICHLAGLLVGIWWAKTGGWAWAGGGRAFQARSSPVSGVKSFFKGAVSRRPRETSTRQRIKQRQADARTVDRILAKVYDKGIHCLTPDEKRALNEATQRLREEEARAEKATRL